MTSDGNNTLVYDAENRVASAANGGASGSYTYDGNGQRVVKSSGGATTVSIFLGDQVLAEYDNGALPSAPTNEYIYAGGQRIMSVQSGVTDYWHYDHLSPRLRTDASGNVADQRGTFPFGDSWYSPGQSPYMLTTYERDTESGNDYAMARFYGSSNARFASPDPIPGSASDPQSLNRYSYAVSDPIDFVDFSGLTCQAVWFGGGVQVMCDPLNNGASADGGGSPHYAPLLDAPDSGGGSSSGSAAANNGNPQKTPWYKNDCIKDALGDFALHGAIDAVGLIPEGGLVSRAVGNYAGYRGIVATQQGTKALQAGKLGTGIATTGVNADDTSGIGVAQTVVGVAGLVPVLGQGAAAVSIVLDGVRAGMDISKCY